MLGSRQELGAASPAAPDVSLLRPPGATFEDDWSPTSPDAEYHGIHSYRIAAARIYGNVLLVAILVNGAKENALDLTWDPRTGQLSFAPPGVRLSTVPFSVVP